MLDESFEGVFEHIIHDDKMRRELLWLRAMEKEDDESIRRLAEVDPDVPRRLQGYEVELARSGDLDDWRQRREGYGRAYDQHLQRLAARVRATLADDG